MRSLTAVLFALALTAPMAAHSAGFTASDTLVDVCTHATNVETCGIYVAGVVDALCPEQEDTPRSLGYELRDYFRQRTMQGASEVLPSNAIDVVAEAICKVAKKDGKYYERVVEPYQISADRITEMKSEIENHWDIPPTIKNGPSLRMVFYLKMNPDGTIKTWDLLTTEDLSNQNYKIAVDAAYKALNDQSAFAPDLLPRDRYEQWKEIRIVLDTSDLYQPLGNYARPRRQNG